jgi:hypothetical protein
MLIALLPKFLGTSETLYELCLALEEGQSL